MWQKIKLPKHLVPACLSLLLLASAPTLSPAQSLQSLQASAQNGDHSAQLYLGQLYDAGTKLPQDYVKARHWYEQAAAANLPEAQNKLGQLLRLGLGGPVDLERAFDLTKQAAADGSAAHVYNLAQMYENGAGTDQDMAKAATLYQQAVELDHVESAVSLGVLYQNGTGVEQDYTRARSLYEPAAAAGHPRAQNNLGLLYTRGNGVKQDYTRAAELFQAAANAGLSTAMTNLSVMYENGFGLPQSDALAAAWARQAKTDRQLALLSDPRLADLSFDDPRAQQMLVTSATAGDPLSQYMLAMVQLKTAEDQQDTQVLPAAATWMHRAAQAGLYTAQANLAILYFRGLGLPQDYVTAHMWITLAALSGAPETLTLRDKITAKMTPEQINQSQQMAQTHWANRP